MIGARRLYHFRHPWHVQSESTAAQRQLQRTVSESTNPCSNSEWECARGVGRQVRQHIGRNSVSECIVIVVRDLSRRHSSIRDKDAVIYEQTQRRRRSRAVNRHDRCVRGVVARRWRSNRGQRSGEEERRVVGTTCAAVVWGWSVRVRGWVSVLRAGVVVVGGRCIRDSASRARRGGKHDREKRRGERKKESESEKDWAREWKEGRVRERERERNREKEWGHNQGK